MRLDFGYFPEELTLHGQDWSLSTLPELPERIARVNNEEHVRQNWYYPGNQRWQTVGSDVISSDPFTHRVFGLPKTHLFELRSSDVPEHVKFLIWVLSFFTGMRLTSLREGFLDATPITRGSLVDFNFIGPLERAVEMGQSYWRDNAACVVQTKRLIGAIHALFLAQYPRHMEFEKFTWLYTALDACFAILMDREAAPKRIIPHAHRITWMCGQVDIPVPVWASLQEGKKPKSFTSHIADLRNPLLHEALYSDEPLGFALAPTASANLPLEMKNFLCRMIAGIIGVSDTEYLTAPVDVFGRFALRA